MMFNTDVFTKSNIYYKSKAKWQTHPQIGQYLYKYSQISRSRKQSYSRIRYSYGNCYHLYKLRHTLFHNHFRLQVAIVDFSLSPTNGSGTISQVVLLENEHVGIAVAIVLLWRVNAEMNVISYALPISCRHFWFFTHPGFVLYQHSSHYVFIDAKNMRIPIKFHIYSICNVRFKCFQFHVHHFDFLLNSNRILLRGYCY